MSKQIIIKDQSLLLDNKGRLNISGYQTRFNLNFNREKLKNKLRIKEWDFYQILNDEYCLQMTIGHVSYLGSISATLFSLNTKEKWNINKLLILPLNSLKMNQNPETTHIQEYKDKDLKMTFTVSNNQRRLTLDVKKKNIAIDILLKNNPNNDKMIIVTPFKKPKQFYLNYKQNDFLVQGNVKYGDKEVIFDDKNTYGLLDWGRGVWPYKHQWYWGSASAILANNKLFSFNIGFGFGDLPNATENMLFYDGKCHKIDEITVNIKDNDYLNDWVFQSNDKRFNLIMTPIHDNFTKTKLLFINNQCHQVFGYFNGTVILDNKEELKITNLLGFCEHAKNQW